MLKVDCPPKIRMLLWWPVARSASSRSAWSRKTSRPRYMSRASTQAKSSRSVSLASHVVKRLKRHDVYNYFSVWKAALWAKEGDIRSFLFTLLLQKAVSFLSVYEMSYDGLLCRVTTSHAFYHPTCPLLALKMDINGRVPLPKTLEVYLI